MGWIGKIACTLTVTILASMPVYASGLKTKDITIGSGAEAQAGNRVVVHYTGWLMDGMKFDSSHDRNRPFSFTIGGRQVIPGWEEGVLGMKVGGKRELVIPPELAYGERGVGDVIPSNAILRFEVELLEVHESSIKNIDNGELKDLLKQGIALVDIRTPAEWKETGVVEGSQLLPFRLANGKLNRDFAKELSKIAKAHTPVILICRSGNRSAAAARLLTQRLGYIKVYNVTKGMILWQEENNPTVQPDEKQLLDHL
jgi:rhodanese-related sulfurtransferase